MASRREKMMGVEATTFHETPEHAAPVAEKVTERVAESVRETDAERIEKILKMCEEQRNGLKELTGTVGNNCTRLDRHRKDIDALDHRVSAMEARCKARCEEPNGADAARASELDNDAAARVDQKSERTQEPERVQEPEPAKPRFNPEEAFPDAPEGTADWVYAYFYTYPAADGSPIWDCDESPNIAKQKGKLEYKAAVWVTKDREVLGKLSPEQARKYVPKTHS